MLFIPIFDYSIFLNFRWSRRRFLERFLLNFKSYDIVFFKIIKLCSRYRKFPWLWTVVTTVILEFALEGVYKLAIEKIKCAGIKMSSKNSREIRIPVYVAVIILPVRTSPTNGRNTVILNSATTLEQRFQRKYFWCRRIHRRIWEHRHQRREYRRQRCIAQFYGALYSSILHSTIVLRLCGSIPLTEGVLQCL